MQNRRAFTNVVVRKSSGAARRFNPRPSESLPSSPSIRGDAVAAPPTFQQPPPGAWPHEDCANEPAGFFGCGERNELWRFGVRVALVLVVLVASWSSHAVAREVGAMDLTVDNREREWQRPIANLCLSIDNRAVVVSDTDRSLAINKGRIAMAVPPPDFTPQQDSVPIKQIDHIIGAIGATPPNRPDGWLE